MKTKLPCLPLIQERMWNAVKDKKEYKDYSCMPDFDIYVFPQIWGTTALGFSGIGGESVTRAYTTVLIDEKTYVAGVFFENELAYLLGRVNELFREDLHEHKMESEENIYKYR